METKDSPNNSLSLKELREKEGKRFSPVRFLREHCPFLFNPHSLFYYFWIVFIIGVFWCFYSLVTNGFTQLYNWDYTWQYIPIGYYTHDVWRNFFATGHFDLYSAETFLGADNIGANAYYGLFDPFVVWMVIFPRSWVPQLFAISTFIKGAVGALAMRAYLRYRGVSESSARIGGGAFAFCGFFNFMVGFPDVVSAVVFLPLILLGIEKVIKENKPTWLSIGIALVGFSNFFYIVVYCVFGVLYAAWRYFMTIKERKGKGWKSHLSPIAVGFFGFAVGLMICSFVLVPSLRNTSLTGRTDSIGQAYLNYLIDSLKSADFKTFFSTIFSMVGDSPGRELMCLVSFFFPTINYSYLPMVVPTGQGYDAWTASIFCYTPIVIFFIYGLVGAVRRKRWGVLGGFALCAIACFTTFSYYFFFLFSGDGYGRWLIVLVPLIIYLATSELDRLREKKNPEWQLPVASAITIFMTVMTLVICHIALDGQTFSSDNSLTYYQSSYNDVSLSSTIYVAIYQIILLVIEVFVIYFLRYKKILPKVLFVFIAVETIVCGNLSFGYGGLWNYYRWFEGGTTAHSEAQRAVDTINDLDDSFYRVYSDYYEVKNDGLTYGYGGTSHFHSLFNYDVVDFARMTGITRNESADKETYGGYTYSSKVWSANYNNKRLGFDMVTGTKYYIIRDEGYYNFEYEDFAGVNVPFNSTLVDITEDYRIYESGLYIDLGHGVDTLYQMNSNDTTKNGNDFYTAGASATLGYQYVMRNEGLFLEAAVVEDDDVERLPEGENFAIQNEAGTVYTVPSYTNFGYTRLSTNATYYVTTEEYGGYHPSDPGLFLHDSSTWAEEPVTVSGTIDIEQDHGKLVYSPKSGTYFNDSDGAYIAMYYSKDAANRIYLIGDKLDEDGNVVEEDALLSYEYRLIYNYIDNDDQGTPLFGLYAEGKVKYIVICPKNGWGDAVDDFNTSNVYFYMIEKDYIDEIYEKYTSSEYALQDVVRVNNDYFTFMTDYEEAKMVVTELGYDEGWDITAYDASGNEIDGVEIYKLDGGLVGFNAPAGEVYYVLEYVTPYLELTVPLSIIGIALLIGFNGVSIYVGYNRKKKKEAEAAS